MVVGQSGLGKSTLIQSLFGSNIHGFWPPTTMKLKSIRSTTLFLNINDTNTMVTVVDTPGFGDAIDNSNCWVPLVNFVENEHEKYLMAESHVDSNALIDNRIHCCLYFITPSGHGLKSLDVEVMKRLCDKVNIVPVIARADTMTLEELQLFKKQVCTLTILTDSMY